MALRKFSASVFRAAICSPPGRESGEVGDGFDSAWMSSVATTVVASADDRFGTSLSCGKCYCAGDALSACFGIVAAVASIVVECVSNIPPINCMRFPGELLG